MSEIPTAQAGHAVGQLFLARDFARDGIKAHTENGDQWIAWWTLSGRLEFTQLEALQPFVEDLWTVLATDLKEAS